MANCEVTFVTNEFRVTNEAEYEYLIKGFVCPGMEERKIKKEDGTFRHIMGGESDYFYYPHASCFRNVSDCIEAGKALYDKDGNEIRVSEIDGAESIYVKNGSEYEKIFDRFKEDEDFDCFLEGLKKILPDDEIFEMTVIYHEKLRDLGASAFLVTNSEVRFVQLADLIAKAAKEMLGSV